MRTRQIAHRAVPFLALWLLSACGPRYVTPAPPPTSARATAPATAPVSPTPSAPAEAAPVEETREETPAATPPPAPPAPAPVRASEAADESAAAARNAVDVPRDATDAPEVAILFDNSSSDYAEVAAQLTRLLAPRHYRLTAVDISVDSSQGVLRDLRQKRNAFLVAIGMPAARMARDQLAGPILFAQVFNFHELLSGNRTVRGVATIPPLDMQLKDWRGLDPGLRRIGLIVGERHSELVSEAERAAASAGITLRDEVSSSDQETLYMFRRLAPQIDGFWLMPDDQILSPGVLREMLDYASGHGIEVSTFNDALLGWGAMQSATSTAADVARTLDRVLGEMIAGKTSGIPVLTPLSEAEIRVNQEVADRLGITPPPGATRILR